MVESLVTNTSRFAASMHFPGPSHSRERHRPRTPYRGRYSPRPPVARPRPPDRREAPNDISKHVEILGRELMPPAKVCAQVVERSPGNATLLTATPLAANVREAALRTALLRFLTLGSPGFRCIRANLFPESNRRDRGRPNAASQGLHHGPSVGSARECLDRLIEFLVCHLRLLPITVLPCPGVRVCSAPFPKRVALVEASATSSSMSCQ